MAAGVANEPRGEIDGDRSSSPERLCELEVVVGEAVVATDLVDGDEDADRLLPNEHRHEEAGPAFDPLGRRLVCLAVIDQGIHPLAAAAVEHPPGLGAGSREPQPDQANGQLTVGGRDLELVFFGGHRDKDEPRTDQLA